MKAIERLLKKVGAFLVDLLKLDQPGKGRSEIYQELAALSAQGKAAIRNYYVKKVSVLLTVFCGGILLSGVGLAVYLSGAGEKDARVLERPGYGEGDRKEGLAVQIEGEEEIQEFEVTVQERKYTEQEKRRLLDAALQELEQALPGENASLDEVRSDLQFPAKLQDDAVKVSWLTVPYGVIGEDGKLKGAEQESGTLVQIQATLTCGGREAAYEAYAKVYPSILSEQEQFYYTLQKEVEQADADDSHMAVIQLPERVEGRNVIWSRPSENPLPALLALTLILTVCAWFQMDSIVHRKAERRKNQLMLDYPDFMWKMTMLLGAGLSIQGAFSRISSEYQRKRVTDRKKSCRKKKEEMRYVYEEVATACYEMHSGISEAQAYERFGRRCQLPEYIRLGSVLSQNLKKGSRGLTSLLEREAEVSLNDRKNHARKIGEQAATKLLLPMVLMLGIVLVILMMPAFLSF